LNLFDNFREMPATAAAGAGDLNQNPANADDRSGDLSDFHGEERHDDRAGTPVLS
jgi:hypothetical protein